MPEQETRMTPGEPRIEQWMFNAAKVIADYEDDAGYPVAVRKFSELIASEYAKAQPPTPKLLNQCAEILTAAIPLLKRMPESVGEISNIILAAQVTLSEIQSAAKSGSAESGDTFKCAKCKKLQPQADRCECGGALYNVTPESGSAGTADGWVSVEERLPSIGQTVLAWKPSSESCDLVVYSQNADEHRRIIRRDGQWWNSGKQITHWRPLPPAPEKA